MAEANQAKTWCWEMERGLRKSFLAATGRLTRCSKIGLMALHLLWSCIQRHQKTAGPAGQDGHHTPLHKSGVRPKNQNQTQYSCIVTISYLNILKCNSSNVQYSNVTVSQPDACYPPPLQLAIYALPLSNLDPV